MCGIVGFTGTKQASPLLLEGLTRLEYRGYDSAGIAVMNGDITVQKTVNRISALDSDTAHGKTIPGKVGIGHTRWATHGAPSCANAHPHLSEDCRFAVVHNGIIENYATLRAELTSAGVHFASETDTEVVPQLLKSYYEGDLLEAVKKTVARLEGSYALGIICRDFPDTLIAVRRFSPLIVGISKGGNFIASDVTAVISHTSDVIYLEDGDIAVITPENVTVTDIAGAELNRPVSRITWDISSAEKGGYDHFMLKEIFEQPQAFRQTVEDRISGGDIVFEGMKLDTAKLVALKRISIVACGSAYHAGMVGKYVFEEMLRIPTEVDLASEFRYRNPIVDKNTLTVIISQSGETADTLAALREAKSRGSHVVAIVNVVGSSIAKEADDVLYTRAGPEIAVATTKGYTTQLAVLYMFAYWAAKRLGTVSADKLQEFLKELPAIPERISEVLSQKENIAQLAKGCGDPASLFFIGRNIDYAVALEASLKLKEISYIHSESYAAGELKHGTISLIEDGRTVIALGCQNALFDKLISNIREVKARGAHIILCCDAERGTCAEADAVMTVPRVLPLLSASVEVIPFQLYAYYAALYKGCDIDKPRNLAKSVTVE